jgi:hypothetical protein
MPARRCYASDGSKFTSSSKKLDPLFQDLASTTAMHQTLSAEAARRAYHETDEQADVRAGKAWLTALSIGQRKERRRHSINPREIRPEFQRQLHPAREIPLSVDLEQAKKTWPHEDMMQYRRRSGPTPGSTTIDPSVLPPHEAAASLIAAAGAQSADQALPVGSSAPVPPSNPAQAAAELVGCFLSHLNSASHFFPTFSS